MVLALVCCCCCGASGAVAKGKPAPKRCPKGQVRLTATSPCVKVRLKPGTTVKVTTAGAEKRFTKLAGRRGARIAAGIVGALVRRPGRARMADAGDDVNDGQWHATEVDGHPGRERTIVTQIDGDELTNTVDSTTEITAPAGKGADLTTSLRIKMGSKYQACPDADGIAKATTEYTQVVRRTAERDGQSAFVEERMTVTTDIAVQVGDDAAIAKVTYDGGGDVEVRATGNKTSRFLMRWTADAQSPDVEDGDRQTIYTRAKADPAAALAGTYRGPHGADLTAEEADLLIKSRAAVQELAEGTSLRNVVSEMRNLWQEDGRCVKLTLDPHEMSLKGGETGTFTATALLVKDGSPIGGKVEEIATNGEADQPHTTMAPGQKLTVKFTMGQGDHGMLLVQLKTKRGTGSDIVEIKRPQGWDVTYEADATYAQTSTEHGDTDTTTMNLHFKADWHGLFFDAARTAPWGACTCRGRWRRRGRWEPGPTRARARRVGPRRSSCPSRRPTAPPRCPSSRSPRWGRSPRASTATARATAATTAG
jgi:hypothetical protein